VRLPGGKDPFLVERGTGIVQIGPLWTLGPLKPVDEKNQAGRDCALEIVKTKGALIPANSATSPSHSPRFAIKPFAATLFRTAGRGSPAKKCPN
jgi:hypothetical protein